VIDTRKFALSKPFNTDSKSCRWDSRSFENMMLSSRCARQACFELGDRALETRKENWPGVTARPLMELQKVKARWQYFVLDGIWNAV
jgi:hypothetical protein